VQVKLREDFDNQCTR